MSSQVQPHEVQKAGESRFRSEYIQSKRGNVNIDVGQLHASSSCKPMARKGLTIGMANTDTI